MTEVTARDEATARSHSENDLPAAPHAAGFFDRRPPAIAVFACVRPHANGGGETTVADLQRILQSLSCADRRELVERTAELRGSASARPPAVTLPHAHGVARAAVLAIPHGFDRLNELAPCPRSTRSCATTSIGTSFRWRLGTCCSLGTGRHTEGCGRPGRPRAVHSGVGSCCDAACDRRTKTLPSRLLNREREPARRHTADGRGCAR